MTADVATPAWMCDESLRELEARLVPGHAALPRVVSFDFFDTLILRLCKEPSDLFVELGRQLARAGQLRLPLTPSEFRSVRISAEEKARQRVARAGKCPEVRLDAIYDELREVISDPAAARDREFTLERSLCVLNPAVASLVEHVRRLGCRVAIVSDTYFTSIELLRLLEERGFPTPQVDVVFASCELGRAKWHNGGLFHDVLRHFDLHPAELLHIGDNLNTDVNQARRLGIEAVHYYRVNVSLGTIFHGEQRMAGQGESVAGSLEPLRVLASRQARGDGDAFRDGALVLGPVLARFADWCVEQYARAGVTRVLALMREGELLGELVRRSAAVSGVPLEVVTCYASRMSTARAAMSTINAEGAAALLEGAEQVSPQTILDILGLTREGEGFLDAESRKRPLPSREAIAKFLQTLFHLPVLRQLIETRQRDSHRLAFEYFLEQVGDTLEVGVLDLGWSGSIQRNIAGILRDGGRKVKTVGCYLACTRRAGRLALEGHEIHGYLDRPWSRSAILAELCINACTGSTTGYARDASGRVQPMLDAYQGAPQETAVKQRISDGVLAFQELWLEQRRRNGHSWSAELLADIDGLSHAILFRWMDLPTKAEADRLGILRHEENYFGSMNNALLCDEKSRARFRRAGTQALYSDASCYWPQGVMAQVSPRIVSVVRNGLDHPSALGSLGSLGGLEQEDGGLTLDETISLRELLRRFGPQQVVFVGAETQANLAGLSAHAAKGGTALGAGFSRVVVAGHDAPDSAAVVELGRHPAARGTRPARVRGSLGEASTLAAIRALLEPGANVALVVGGDISESDALAVLYGLAPFLGPQGVVLLSTGRYDRYEVGAPGHLGAAADNPIHRACQSWFESTSAALGYGIWDGQGVHLGDLQNWIVLLHAPETMFWSGQWMPVVTDLGYRDPQVPPGEVRSVRSNERTETPSASGAHPVQAAAAESGDSPFPAVPAAASDR